MCYITLKKRKIDMRTKRGEERFDVILKMSLRTIPIGKYSPKYGILVLDINKIIYVLSKGASLSKEFSKVLAYVNNLYSKKSLNIIY